MKLSLTDSEWIQLLDGNSEDSQLPVCCANISALRDTLSMIVRNGRNSEIGPFEIEPLKQRFKWVADGHDLTPLLHKVAAQIGFNPEKEEHKPERFES